MIAAFERRLDRLGRWLMDGPGLGYAEVATGLGVWAFALGLRVNGERVAWWGHLLPAPCGYAAATGRPCPTCGASRAWAWLVAGEPGRALGYHPAATLALLGFAALIGVGALRIRRGRPGPAWPWLAAGGAWLVVFGVGWVLRSSGSWPLVIPR